MSANIFGSRFFARETPAWHNLGTVFPKDARFDLVEATSKVVDYKILDVPVYAFVNGEFVLIDGRKALVRTPTSDDPTYRPLEVVSNGYQKVDEFILADIFNDISKVWSVETIGILNNGQTLFATLDAGMFEIKGDLIHQYFLLTDAKDRRSATTAAYTPIRVVCQNTLTVGLSQATLRLNVAHRGDNHTNLRKIAVSVKELQERMNMTNSLFLSMANTSYSMDEFKAILKESIYPDPIVEEQIIDVTKDYDALFERQREQREAAVELFVKFNDEHSQVAGTKWAAYNAIVELEDWKPGRGQRQWTSAVFGQRSQIKAAALESILKYE